MTPKSCDTMVALPAATAHGQTLFAKNSDRPWDECQPLELHPRRQHPAGAVTRCQFVSLPEVQTTWRHIGSRPWWCWGYEHGANEHQVVIGNEGLASRFDSAPESRLIGMEILRLGLERGRTAREAVDAMTALISQHGQGKFDNDADVRTYDNGYIVADPREAWVIETAGHEWAVQRVDGALGISNVYSVETDDQLSPTARQTATDHGWWRADQDGFNFADAYSRNPRDEGSGCMRRRRACAVLDARRGTLDPSTMMQLLADHSDAGQPDEPFRTDLTGKGICIHFEHGDDGPHGGNTAASLVSDLCADGTRLAVHWCCLYSPCLSAFVPVFVEGDLPSVLADGGQHDTAASPWWRFHRLALALRDPADGSDAVEQRIAAARARWAPLQQEWLQTAYPLAAEARGLFDAGDADEARRRLTAYMDEGVRRLLDTADHIVGELTPRSRVA